MRLLLTGADGFTGKHLVRLARLRGHDVFCLRANLLDSKALENEVLAVAPEYVCHLAAISSITHSDHRAFYDVNLFGTSNLVGALLLLKRKPHKILLASSANVYGNCSETPIDETVCPQPVNHYAMSKLAMEHMILPYADRLPIVITRPFNYTGPGHDSRFVIPKIIKHFAEFAQDIELGNLDVEREYNDVRMVCSAYLDLLELDVPSGEIINICTGKGYSLRRVLRSMQDLTGHTINVKVNPEFIRSNEVLKLVGNPRKIKNILGISMPIFELSDTLNYMLCDSKLIND